MTSLSNRNIPLFIAFRVFFNARWYYPVLAVLFLKLGLTLEQYALLNVAWAISIVCLEIPSGALADQIGRRRIIMLAAALMVIEMGLFAFAPRGSSLLFPLLLLNRLLSGAAEACASGADESLAYDSLREDGREAEWPAVLVRLMRWQSVAFFITMLLGAAVYDPALVRQALEFAGVHLPITGEMTMRWPLYLTLGNALIVCLVVAQMREPGIRHSQVTVSAGEAWRQTLASGRWILRTPLVLSVIVAGLCIDSVVRLFLTLCSNYYKLIGLPEASFGAIAAGFAVFGFFTPKLAQWLAGRCSMAVNFLIVACLAFAGLMTAARFWQVWGLLAVIPLSMAMSMLQFFLSHYLNRSVTDSSQRATILSFKGLSFNLAYGAAGLLFAGFTRAKAGAGT
ncbi:MAG: transporter, partial [Chthoniobacteraceae bacterium]|nr:transporter [Chthoniobacteraceae bacterium]